MCTNVVSVLVECYQYVCLFLQAADDYSITHDGDAKEAILFSFKSKAFFGKKKVRNHESAILL